MEGAGVGNGIWSYVATTLSAIVIMLISYLIHKQGSSEDKAERAFEKVFDRLATIMTTEDCRTTRLDCGARVGIKEVREDRTDTWEKHEQEHKELRRNLFHHSHTGLPLDSVVKAKD